MANDHFLKKPEILAPAGTYDAFEAAVNAGADAVYLGGSLFSARAFAGNFSEEELLRAIDHAHLLDVKVYLTVNTLFKEAETSLLCDYLRPYYKAGVDAVLVQDPGAAFLIKNAYPDLPLHASTQMSVASRHGAAFLKNLGFTRIVPARELSLEEIRAIKEEVDIEIETFIHGAMCFSYSGKCLFSSFLGGRSGNRGRCAQPCRKCYSLQTGKKPVREYIMSLKDMCTLDHIGALMDAGIDSFKIEGRMKNPEYVAAVTHAYRTVRDLYWEAKTAARGSASVADKEITKEAGKFTKELKDIYNRGGFCAGYYGQAKGPDMLASDRPNHTGVSVGTVRKVSGPEVEILLCEDVNEQDILEIREAGVELTSPLSGKRKQAVTLKGRELKKIRPGMQVYRTRNNRLLEQIRTNLIAEERTTSVKARTEVLEGKPLSLTLEQNDICVRVEGNQVERASRQSVTKEQLESKLKKSKGSHLSLETEYRIDEQMFVSMSEFNNLRRQAMEAFKQKKEEAFHRDKIR